MTTTTRAFILRANAVYLGLSAAVAFLFLDLPALAFGLGPEARVLARAPFAAVGFVEAHGLACILSVLYWRAAPMPTRAWHLTAAAAAALLGTANLVFWQGFVESDAVPMGYVTTLLHWTFVVAQLAALIVAGNEHERPACLDDVTPVRT